MDFPDAVSSEVVFKLEVGNARVTYCIVKSTRRVGSTSDMAAVGKAGVQAHEGQNHQLNLYLHVHSGCSLSAAH